MGFSFRYPVLSEKRMEYNLIGQVLMEGPDVYLPLVDDYGLDCGYQERRRYFWQ